MIALNDFLRYDPETGTFMREYKANRKGRKTGFKVCGRINKRGYMYVPFRGKTCLAHRLAWLAVHGEWPTSEIDHIDGNRANNVITNLRLSNRSLQMQNQHGPRRDNKIGVIGVKQDGNSYMARIGLNGKRKYLGSFRTIEEASAAYQSAKRELHTV